MKLIRKGKGFTGKEIYKVVGDLYIYKGTFVLLNGDSDHPIFDKWKNENSKLRVITNARKKESFDYVDAIPEHFKKILNDPSKKDNFIPLSIALQRLFVTKEQYVKFNCGKIDLGFHKMSFHFIKNFDSDEKRYVRKFKIYTYKNVTISFNSLTYGLYKSNFYEERDPNYLLKMSKMLNEKKDKSDENIRFDALSLITEITSHKKTYDFLRRYEINAMLYIFKNIEKKPMEIQFYPESHDYIMDDENNFLFNDNFKTNPFFEVDIRYKIYGIKDVCFSNKVIIFNEKTESKRFTFLNYLTILDEHITEYNNENKLKINLDFYIKYPDFINCSESKMNKKNYDTIRGFSDNLHFTNLNKYEIISPSVDLSSVYERFSNNFWKDNFVTIVLSYDLFGDLEKNGISLDDDAKDLIMTLFGEEYNSKTTKYQKYLSEGGRFMSRTAFEMSKLEFLKKEYFKKGGFGEYKPLYLPKYFITDPKNENKLKFDSLEDILALYSDFHIMARMIRKEKNHAILYVNDDHYYNLHQLRPQIPPHFYFDHYSTKIDYNKEEQEKLDYLDLEDYKDKLMFNLKVQKK